MIYNILCVYILVSMFALIYSIAPLTQYDYKPGDFKSLFVFQRVVYEMSKDQLNILGIAILEMLTTILTFGASITLFVVGVVVLVFTLSWKLFCFIFKKR